jgi:hypothetical protein
MMKPGRTFLIATFTTLADAKCGLPLPLDEAAAMLLYDRLLAWHGDARKPWIVLPVTVSIRTPAVFLRWCPGNGDSNEHHEDVELARAFVAATGHLGSHCRFLLRLRRPPLANLRSVVSQCRYVGGQ